MIQGSRIEGIEDYYAELNRLVMQQEDWVLGASLDGLSALRRHRRRGGDPALVFVWHDHAHSRSALGVSTTRKWLQGKQNGPFNQDLIARQLADLSDGHGRTYSI